MFIDVLHYNFKPGTDVEELTRIFNEIVAPLYRQVPGLLSVTGFKHLESEGNPPEWEYTSVWVWQNKEAKEMEEQSAAWPQLKNTGFFAKFWESVEKSAGTRVVPFASTNNEFFQV